ncbi:G4 quadruplex nucleic acid binding protein [Kappamyces sp. JEL0680]|nr:G4 quadruplex nucleic acid binding protein [Kappamyces sp. JEL0680]
MLGRNEKEKQEIAQWSLESLKSWKHKVASTPSLALESLDALLKTRVFLACNFFSLADILMYSVLYNVAFTQNDRLEHCNVVRYFDLVQNLVFEDVAIPELALTEFDLDLPPPPPAASAKEVAKTPASTPEVKSSSGGKKDVADKTASAKGDQKASPQTASPALLDIRVGRVLSVERHPDAEALYVESIDVGEASPRTVVSGLVKYMKEDELNGQLVALLCNLKPAKMRGIESAAMVLCASSADGTTVEFLRPPAGSKPGDVLSFEGYKGTPEAVLKPKAKVWEQIQPHLFTTPSLEASFTDPATKKVSLLKGPSGTVTVKSVKGASIK